MKKLKIEPRKWVQPDSLVMLTRILVVVYSVMNLILSNRHINALLKLQNEICGFYMFAFVLVGLMMLFEASRMKELRLAVLVRGIVISALEILMGSLLLAIYREGRVLDPTIDESVLVKSERVIWTVIILAFLAVCTEVAAFVLEQRKRKREKS
ncbi:MAG: hypothetical protein LUJ09_00390 [Firmicutes bacterium]|nr:hypothetical protein [Bacillota bacterium]